MTQIAYQLYCSRNFPPLAETLQMLSDVGISAVEGYGALLDDPTELKSALASSGLTMPSCHVGLDLLESDPDGTIALLGELGVKKAYVPYLAAEDRPVNSDGWQAFADRLVVAGKPLREAGFVYGWHNHDFEFVTTPEGDLPMDIIASADPGLLLELDLGWVQRAGHDPLATIAKYAGKIATAHIKDVAPEGDCADEDGWADVGHGVIDWSAIHATLKDAGVDHYVIEHDNPKDHQRFASRSFATLQSL
ncbi:sugar phosphate isomerase/epimerase family protein [Yoonia litorea]|uniref:Sugar phosphate isomerase/epimerase n=1 Tax=Yoonia litorea TaxID=1123755 RepID=A0A1I6MZM4_9RHOB|nr:sugar phosphate isomerase/epimerase [Yoonia litorea]SFS21087.1 Sugar phosphate isomerase/epimerase [Yoonia litorea]